MNAVETLQKGESTSQVQGGEEKLVNWLFSLVERAKKVYRIKANNDREKKRKNGEMNTD